MGILILIFCAHNVPAALKWEATSKSIKVHPLQASATVRFLFVNTGLEPVEMLEIKPTCDCLSGKVEKQIYTSGEKGVLEVVFNLEKREGPQRKALLVKTSADSGNPLSLYVSTRIPETFKASSKRLVWNPNEERKAKSIRIINQHQKPFHLAKAVPSREGVGAKLKAIRDGYEYELVVQPSAGRENGLVPIKIHPEVPEGVGKVKIFTVYALLK